MSKTPPERHKSRESWTVEETVEHQRTGTVPETDQYRDYVRQVHEDAGLEPPEGTAEPKEIGEMSTDEIYEQRVRRH
jgi:hypothetical protein